jgi:hypothetical protein
MEHSSAVWRREISGKYAECRDGEGPNPLPSTIKSSKYLLNIFGDAD